MTMSPFPTPVGTSDVHRQVTGGTVDSNHREGWRTHPDPLFEIGAAYERLSYHEECNLAS